MRRLSSHRGRPCHRRGSQAGLTLIELAITAVVVVVVVLAATAGLRSFQAQQRLQGLAQNLVADLQLARASSLGTAQAVVLRTSNDGRGYRILRCDPGTSCALAVDTIRSVDLPGEVSITAGRAFEFNAPRAIMAQASQSACLNAPAAPNTLKVSIDNSLGKAAACSVGTASSGLPVCSSGC